MSDDLKDRARFVVQLFRECDAIQLPHKPTEEVLLGMIARIEELEARLANVEKFLQFLDENYRHAFGDIARQKILELYEELKVEKD